MDLGLSVLWAEANIGANSATDYGNYYAWGEVTAYNEETNGETKTNYSWSTYKWTEDNGSSFAKYTADGKTTLDKEDDAAYVNWGSSCRMPTKDEFDELVNSDNCKCIWDDGEEEGCKITSKKTGYEGNSIFFPASGYRDGGNLKSQRSNGGCWSSSLVSDGSSYAYHLFVGLTSKSDYYNRYIGFAVRPVAEKP